ncbi:PAS domain S-box protein [Candidatus Sumerlaeota bacterium]|nr:PAS domain S-box protein [Candidatus Sumerlaeota bacterium]
MDSPKLISIESEVLEALAFPALMFDPGSRQILVINSALASVSGYAPAESPGMNVHLLLDFSKSAVIEEIAKKLVSSAVAKENIAGRILPKEGTAVAVEITLSRFHCEGQTCVLAVMLPRKRKEKKGASETVRDGDYYRELFEYANDLIYTIDLEGKITSANRAILNALGYTIEEALNMSVISVVDKAYIPIVRKQIEMKLKEDRFTAPYEVLCHKKSGDKVWLEVSTRLLTRNGSPVAIQGIARDITERKLGEEILKDSNERIEEQRNLLEQMIEQNPFAIAFWNPDGTFHRCNAAFVKLIGAAPAPHYNILKDRQMREDGTQPLYLEAFKGKTVNIERAFYDVSLTPKSNFSPKPIWVSLTLFPIVGTDGKIIRVVSLYQEITQQVQAEDAKSKLERQLQESQKLQAIGTLAGGVAHDFNNLLTGVMGYLDLIRSITGPDVHPYVEKAEVVTQRGSELTRQLLAYARKSRLETRIHDLNTTAHEVAALMAQTVDKRIEIRTRVSPTAATVQADPGQMSQILLNLCVNARDVLVERLNAHSITKFGEWEPRISIEVKHHLVTPEHCRRHGDAREGIFIRLSVSDNGTGMDEATRQRIFEPFFTTKDVGKGTGLGLATVFGIVKQHGGWVEVESELNQGSVFRVYLPLVSAPAEPLSTAAASLKIKGGNETLLLVDDEPMIREIGQKVLEDRGYTVLLANDGKSALEVFNQEKDNIKAVILDMTMPRLSGRELLPRILRIKPGMKIIAISGFSFSESWGDFHGMGAAAFIQKPFNALDLAQTVRRVLDQ